MCPLETVVEGGSYEELDPAETQTHHPWSHQYNHIYKEQLKIKPCPCIFTKAFFYQHYLKDNLHIMC